MNDDHYTIEETIEDIDCCVDMVLVEKDIQDLEQLITKIESTFIKHSIKATKNIKIDLFFGQIRLWKHLAHLHKVGVILDCNND